MSHTNSSLSILREGIYLLVSYMLSLFIPPYLRIEINPLVVFPLTAILYWCHRTLHLKRLPQRHLALWLWSICLFSALLSLSLICGKHIQLDYTYLTGQSENNAFSPLKLKDFIAFLILTYSLSIILYSIFRILLKSDGPYELHGIPTGLSKLQYKTLIAGAFIIVVAWLPYFLIYYPGLIFGDSLNSITEALHYAAYENHFPLFYTLFIELCLRVGILFGSLTLGCAIYTIVQMLYLAFTLSYIICWLHNKGISRGLCLFVLLAYSTMSCFPQHAISMWKDPIFSVTVVFYGIKLVDLGLSKGVLAHYRPYLFQLCISAMIICLSRNNGIYILIFSLFCTLGCAWKSKWISAVKNVIVLHLTGIIFLFLLTGPIYSFLHIGKDDIESFGIPLQQLARTIVYDGNINSADHEFLGKLLPIERWDEVYTPGLVDSIKWDSEFSKAFFEEHKIEFLLVWLRNLIKNPMRYFESWCLSTYGYWVPNLWELNNYTTNITSGNIEALSTWWIPLPIQPQNLLGNDALTSVFSLTTPLPASGLLTWAMAFMCLWATLSQKAVGILLFVPLLGNLITLFLAAPSAYWPRYTLATLYAIPLILLFPLFMRIDSFGKDRRNINE